MSKEHRLYKDMREKCEAFVETTVKLKREGEMTDSLQPKIDKWWAGLTPKEREEWWSEGDRVHSLGDDYTVISVFPTGLVVADKFGSHVATPQTSVPIDSPQLWWKLEAWLGEDLVTIAPNQPEPQYEMMPNFIEDEEGELKKTERRVFKSTDRRHALLDACLAVQRGEG